MSASTFGELMTQAAASGASFEVLEAGRYISKCIESEAKQSSTGKPQIKTRWEVIAGPKAGAKGLWLYLTLTTDNPAALSIFYRQLTAMGISGEFLSSLASVDPDTAIKHLAGALLNATAMLNVVIDTEYANNKVKNVLPVPPEYGAVAAASAPPSDPFAAAASAPPPVAAPVTAPPAAPAVPQTAPAAPAPSGGGPLPAPPFSMLGAVAF